VGQVVGGQYRGGVTFEVAGVFGGDGEDDLGAGVGGDPLPQVGRELGEVLVGHGHAEPVGAGLGQHVFERVGQVQEVLRLVDVQAGVGPGGLGDAGPAGRGLPGARDDERAGQLRGLLTEDPFGQPGQAQPAVVQDGGHVEGGRPGGDGLPGEPAEQERAEFVHQRADGVRPGGH
jgi:hypothetical protein